MNDTQTAFLHLYNKLSNLQDKYFPKSWIQLKYNYKKPWLSEGLRQAIKTKNKLYRKSLIIKSSYNESTYKRYRNKLRRVLLSEKKRYYAELLHKNKNNMKNTWLILKNIVNKGISKRVQSTFKIHDATIISDKAIISETFNDFFTNIGPTLAKSDHIPITVHGRSGIQQLILGTCISRRNWHDSSELKTFSSRTWRNYYCSFTISPPIN